jgi:uncharacterized protein YbgA (DUF1722 family)/uncharacterized protein YbbK (DUF523 family)
VLRQPSHNTKQRLWIKILMKRPMLIVLALKEGYEMRKFSKPFVVVSKCITFAPVGWDKSIIVSDFVEKLKPHVSFMPVCPEVEIGLGVPRSPIRIVLVNGEKRLMQPLTGLDFTEKMNTFADSFLTLLDRKADGFILKSGSPSSGFKNVKVYPKLEKSALIARGPGFFGEAVLEKFPFLAIEDERRLLNPRIKEHFLTKLFTFASFREAKESGTINDLVRFQSQNKYLLTAYSQKELRIMGKIAANQEQKPCKELFETYEMHLYRAFGSPPSIGSNINVMFKILGYFSDELSKEEKDFFIKSLQRYKEGKLPLSANISILKSWIIRFKQEYLMDQTFLEPYPEDLYDLDSFSAEFMAKEYWK